MLFALFFTFWRLVEIVTLIPTMGMLAYFVNLYNSANQLSPNYILILFIVSVIALAWAIFTLFSYHRSSANATFVALIDLGFVGAFIAGVYYLRFIGNADCTNVTVGSSNGFAFVGVSSNKNCAMLKACFAFGIMNCIFFFITSILAWFHGDRMAEDNRKTYYRETHYSSRGHRHSRSPHTRSRHSSHSARRSSYV